MDFDEHFSGSRLLHKPVRLELEGLAGFPFAHGNPGSLDVGYEFTGRHGGLGLSGINCMSLFIHAMSNESNDWAARESIQLKGQHGKQSTYRTGRPVSTQEMIPTTSNTA